MSRVVVLDNRAPDAENIAAAALLNGWRLVRVTEIQDMRAIAAHIVAAAAGSPIAELRLMAHGSPGQMQLGLGLSEFSAYDLAPVARHMRGGLLGSVWCFACNAAAATRPNKWTKTALLESGFGGQASITGGRGFRFLRELSRVLRTRVLAPIEVQFLSGWNYQTFFLDRIQFRGVSLEVTPYGSYRLHYPDGSSGEATQFA